MTTVKDIYKQAQRLDVCPLFTGNESVEEVLDLLLSPQGIEFCTDNNFPDMATFRAFSGLTASRKGVYIDTDISLLNPKKVVLVGNTTAELTYDNTDCGYEVVLMHGAKAKIKASGHAIVFVTNAGSQVEKEISDSAMIL